MIYKCGDANFKFAWLDYIVQDPVHPTIDVYKRITGSRSVFVYAENNEPQYIVSAKIGSEIARSVKEILTDDGDAVKEAATFYSIFRVPGSSNKGEGGRILKLIIDYCKLHGVNSFSTLSPIPYLKTKFDCVPEESKLREHLELRLGPVERFHLNNGATIGNINYDADDSALRIEESWGTMVNYKYSI